MNQDFQIICINAPEGCRHGTHTNGTAYIRGTYSRVHTQTHTNTNKHRNVARQSTARTHAVAAPSSSEVSGITTDSTLSTFFSPFPYC
jgi:hypothetical protein